ncbi:hypothetical protein EPUS_08552 [Endocarpon pusillum Z07020]|uniref:Aflatoxin regulatory protein domain-containing protein n=1 Tax=Endocarpon pusillum (strain Z07020 / HMAS-L-300199) TaxID=1263415 RepID=U1HVL4_ENDPU|nr:uncharacterized protein EPUS_08552 [Endocarpon pusillum Z07020]ERF73409.1 hypothetical protein EPUS_08552 [Endocarpon pusillum Z07020]
MSGTNPATGTKEQVLRRGQGQGQGQGVQQPSVGVGSGQAGRIQPHRAYPSVEMGDPEPRADQDPQQMEHRCSSYSVGDRSSSGNVLDGLDEWLDMDSFLNPGLTAPLENLDGSLEMLNEAMEDSLSGHASSPAGLDDMASGTSPSSFPNADNLVQALMPPHDVVSPLALDIPSTRRQPSASATNGDSTGQDSLSLTPSLGRWSGQPPTILNNIRPSPGSPDRLKPSLMFDPHTKGPVPAAPAASSPSLTRRSDAKDGCPCLHLMACLLEELGAESASSDQATMDLLLGYLRCALVRCSTVLDCERCTSLSDNNMLLAMVGQYMSTICERMVMCYIGLQGAQEQRQSKQQPSVSSLLAGVGGTGGDQEDGNGGTRSGSGVLDADEIWFSTYRIDDGWERMQVLQCLASVQLIEFSRMLEKLKARGGSHRGHLVLLTEAEKRIKAVQLMLRTKLNRPSAGRISSS